MDPVFNVLAQRMDYLKQRQAVIGENVANVNSPGYKARDLEDFSKVLEAKKKNAANGSSHTGAMTIALTNSNHIAPSGTRVGGDYAYKKDKDTYEVLPGGNSVVIEEQMVKVAAIQADYQLATNLYKRMNGMVKLALGK
jgi:flagellar basal-body rod protein FlgB